MSERICAVCRRRGYLACHCRPPNLDDPVEYLASQSAAIMFLRAGIIARRARAEPAVPSIVKVKVASEIQPRLPFVEEDDNG
jgi:hypothetical protein